MERTLVMKSTGEEEPSRLDGADRQESARSLKSGTGGPKRSGWIAPTFLLLGLIAVIAALAAWKINSLKARAAQAAQQPEPVETVILATATERQHRRTTTSIGTVVALRSITLRNEVPGTVQEVHLTPGQIVEAGTVLVALDVSVEEAELKAQEAQAALAQTVANRMERAVQSRAVSAVEGDRARAELDVAKAQIERIKAVIARKTIRAPFRARIGISDVHKGQYLNEGTLITTLQGIDEATHVDFEVPQLVAQTLKEGDTVEIIPSRHERPVPAEIVALDSLVNPVTRNTTIRARVANAEAVPHPGASVRVRIPTGEPVSGVAIPASSLRKGPAGDHVFVVATGQDGKPRAQMRRVQVAASLGDEVLILSGLAPGETVAASGSFKLREGVLVVAANQDPAKPAGN